MTDNQWNDAAQVLPPENAMVFWREKKSDTDEVHLSTGEWVRSLHFRNVWWTLANVPEFKEPKPALVPCKRHPEGKPMSYYCTERQIHHVWCDVLGCPRKSSADSEADAAIAWNAMNGDAK